MKIVAYLVGSEPRWLTCTQPTDIRKLPYLAWVKIRARLLKPFISEWWTDAEYLIPFIKAFYPKAKTRVVKDELKYTVKYRKWVHPIFCVMYYYPANEYNKNYCRWVYGKDIIENLIRLFPDFYWIRIDGTNDLSKVFPMVDAYIRPNRHDGTPRLIEECKIQEIPYLHTQHDPDTRDFINFLTEQYENYNKKSC